MCHVIIHHSSTTLGMRPHEGRSQAKTSRLEALLKFDFRSKAGSNAYYGVSLQVL